MRTTLPTSTRAAGVTPSTRPSWVSSTRASVMAAQSSRLMSRMPLTMVSRDMRIPPAVKAAASSAWMKASSQPTMASAATAQMTSPASCVRPVCRVSAVISRINTQAISKLPAMVSKTGSRPAARTAVPAPQVSTSAMMGPARAPMRSTRVRSHDRPARRMAADAMTGARRRPARMAMTAISASRPASMATSTVSTSSRSQASAFSTNGFASAAASARSGRSGAAGLSGADWYMFHIRPPAPPAVEGFARLAAAC